MVRRTNHEVSIKHFSPVSSCFKSPLNIFLQSPAASSLLGPNVSFHNLYFIEYSQGEQTKEDEMIGECSMHASCALCIQICLGSRDSVVYTVTGVRAGRSCFRTPVGERDVFFFKTIVVALGPTKPLVVRIPGSFPCVTRLGL